MNEALEIRLFTCPKCNWQREDHIFLRSSPWGITCKDCSTVYWWSWKHEALFVLVGKKGAPEIELISNEHYKLK